MNVQSYLMFNGRCEEAAEFYSKAIGAKVEMMMRFEESPDQQPGSVPPGAEKKIMHMALRIGDDLVMASDGHCTGSTAFQGFSLALSADTEADAARCFDALANGGKVNMPLTKTFFSPQFGMLTDKFGVDWMVLVKSGA